MSVESQVYDILASYASVSREDISADSKLTDLEIDSVALVEIIFDVEEAFDVTVPEQDDSTDAEDFQTAGDVVKAMETLINDTRAAQ
jgi:acyl carrier protein